VGTAVNRSGPVVDLQAGLPAGRNPPEPLRPDAPVRGVAPVIEVHPERLVDLLNLVVGGGLLRPCLLQVETEAVLAVRLGESGRCHSQQQGAGGERPGHGLPARHRMPDCWPSLLAENR